MTSFCNCSTCKSVKKKIKYPECSYCHEHHDPRLCCPAMNKALADPTPCPACGTIHEKNRVGCPDVEFAIRSILKRGSEYFVDVDGCKYSVYQEKGGALKALRYGEPWRDLTGDNLAFSLMVELIEAKEKLQKIKESIHPKEKSFISVEIIADILEGKK